MSGRDKVLFGPPRSMPDAADNWPGEARLSRAADACALATAAIGVLALAGWLLGIEPLKRVLPSLVAMKFNTALAFVMGGLALWWRHRPALRLALGAMVTTFGALALGEYLSGGDWGIDQIFFRDVPTGPDASFGPGLMAPSTSIGFLLCGVALMCSRGFKRGVRGGSTPTVEARPGRGFAAEVLAFSTAAIAVFALIGYATGTESLRYLPGFISMALNTAAAFVLLAVGILCAVPDGLIAQVMRSRATGRTLWLGFGLLTILLATLGVTAAVRLQAIAGGVYAQRQVAQPRVDATRELEINVVDYALEVRTALTGRAEARQRAAQEAAEVRRYLAEYKAVCETDRQRELAARFAEQWQSVYAQGQALLANRTPPSEQWLNRLADLHAGLEEFLDHQMQMEAIEAYDIRLAATLRDLQNTGIVILSLLVAGVLISMVTSGLVSRAVLGHAQALSESEEKFSTMFHATPVATALATIPEGRIHDVNDAWLNLTGFKSKEEALGKTSAELGLVQDEETRDRILAEFRQNGLVSNAEMTFRDSAGSERTVLVGMSQIAFGGRRFLLSTNLEITKRKRAEKELRYHANLIENVSDAIISTDKELNIRSWSKAAERMYGWKADEVIGLKGSSVLETTFPEGSSREAIAKDIFEKGGWEGELIQRTKDGRNIIVQARSMALRDEAGNVIGGVSIGRDISERKQVEQKLAWLASFPGLNPNPIVEIDLPGGEVKYANPPAERLFPDLIRLGAAHPFLAGARERVNAAPSKGEQAVREVAIGDAWYLETMSLTPDRQRLRVYGLDITKRKRTEEALSESVGRERERAREWAALLDAVPTPVFVTHDPDGRRITGNRAADELLCNPRGGEASLGAPENARPHHFRAFKDGREMSVDELPAQRAARGERVAGLEFSLVFDDGTIRDVIGYGMPLLDAEGRPRGSILTLTDITERNRAAEALRESEKRLVRAQEMASLGSWELDVAQNRVNWSDEVYRLFGFQPEAFDATYEAFFEAVHPEDRAALDASFMDSVREGRDSFESEYRIIRRDNGETRFVHTKSENMRDENGRIVRSIGMIHDITEQKKTEALRQALAEQERLRLGAAVEQASDSVVMFDLDGTIRYVNAAFESIDRIPRERAIGRSYFELFGNLAEASSIQQAFAQGKAWHGPLTYQTPDGRALDLEMTVSPIRNPDGTIIGGLATATDVTRQSALQQQIRQAQKMEALGTLAGGITHDFNNILGTIIINTELALLDMDLSDPGRKSLPIVLQAANRGKELVKQIITFSRQRAWERKPLEIAATVKEGLGLLRSTLPKDISVHEKIDPRSGIVLADPSHIHQILVNLCQNAALAMMDCGGDLKVGLGPIEVDAFMAVRNPDLKPGPYVRLTVSDTGCGMGSDILDRIFEPFFTTRQQGKGSGLGLAVVHGIVKSYDGAIAVQSQPGQGSVFSIYLHRLEGAAATPGVEPPVHAVGGRERILLVEDEETQRTSLARGLEHLGYKITAAADGRSALAEFRKDPNSFDLVITDQTMPKMSGLELASEMAKIRPDISIILCTGFSEKVDDGTVGRYGIRELVMKPFTITEITQAIGKAVKGTRL